MNRATRGRRETAALVFVAVSAACVLQPATPSRPRGIDLDRTNVALQVATDPGPPTEEPPVAATDHGALDLAVSALKDLGRVPSDSLLLPLGVPGFPDAVISPPAIPHGRRPVVIVLHGLGDRPETHCDAWRNVTHAFAYVLCPRGEFDPRRSTPGRARYTLAGGAALQAHVDAALAALTERYGDQVDPTTPLLAGFSLGATEAAVLALENPTRFPRVVLVEGGLDVWVPSTIEPYLAGGGRRALFGCGSDWCTPSADGAASRVEAAGGEARVVVASVGHHDVPPLQEALGSELDWLLDGDDRWTESGVAELASCDGYRMF